MNTKEKALGNKMYVSPTGSKHRIGSQKHKYWEALKKKGADDEKYAREENKRFNR